MFIESALQLLGEDSQDYVAFFADNEEKYEYLTIKTLGNLYIHGELSEMRRLTAEAEGKKSFTSGIFLQYINFSKAVSDEKLTNEERLDKLLDAIQITHKNFDNKKLKTTVFTYNEITIIGEIAATYHRLGDSEKAVQIIYGLKASMNRNYMDEWEKSRTYPMILFNLSVYLGALERNEEMYDACIEVKQYAIKYNNMRVLPRVLATIAHYHFLKEDYVGYKSTLLEAYFSARGMGQYSLSNLIAKIAKERYNVDVEAVLKSF